MSTLKENVHDLFDGWNTIPNWLSFIRIALIPVFAVLFVQGHQLVAVIVMICAALTDLFVEVIRYFLSDDFHCTACQTGIDCDKASTSTHNFYNAATVMRLAGILQLVNHFHASIHCGIITDGIFSTSNVVIDCTRQTNASNALCGQICCTTE